MDSTILINGSAIMKQVHFDQLFDDVWNETLDECIHEIEIPTRTIHYSLETVLEHLEAGEQTL
jgi:hypothetical protein